VVRQSFFLRRFRLFTWSLLLAGLVALAFALHTEVLPQPRCTIVLDRAATVICLSADGARLVTHAGWEDGNWKGPVQIWDTVSGRALAVFPELHGRVSNLGNSPTKSRRFFCETNRSGDLLLLDVAAGRLRQTRLKGLDLSTRAFHFSRKEDLVAVYIRSEPPWYVRFSALVASGVGIMGSPPGEACLLAASAHNTYGEDFLCHNFICHVVETATGRLRGTVEGVANDRRFLEFTADGGLLLLGMRDPLQDHNAVAVWDTSSGKMKRVQKNFQPILVSPDGRKVLGRTRAGYVLVDLATGRSDPTALPADLKLDSSKFFPDSQTLVTYGFLAGRPRIDFLEVTSGKSLGSEEGLVLESLEFSPDSTAFLLSTRSWLPELDAKDPNARNRGRRHVKVADSKTRQTLWEPNPSEYWLFTADSQCIVATLEKQADVHETKTGRGRKTIPIEGGAIRLDSKYVVTMNTVADPEARFLASRRAGAFAPGSADESIKVIELPDGREIGRFNQKYQGFWWSEDSRTLVAQERDDSRLVLRCWNLATSMPYRRPLWQVVGLPVGLGLLIVLATRLFPRVRQVATAGESPVPGPRQ
jgi:hypothetical protein